jgi:hypothetical protein
MNEHGGADFDATAENYVDVNRSEDLNFLLGGSDFSRATTLSAQAYSPRKTLSA